MSATGRVLFWACAVIAVFIGGVAFSAAYLAGDIALAIFIVVGLVALGLVLRWVVSGGEDW